MRKTMTKEVTFTIIHFAEIKTNENKEPYMHRYNPITVMGSYLPKAAEKLIRETHPKADVYNTEQFTKVYEMEVEEFIKHAKIKENDDDQES